MDILVSTRWLADALADPLNGDRIAILDASAHLPAAGRDPAAEFAECHIPGARFLDLPSLKDETSPVPAALPRADQLEARLGALGVENGQRIIIYDNSMLHSSARAYFIFRMFGIDNVSILDGGLPKWLEEGHPHQSGTAAPAPPTRFSITQDDRSRVRSKAQVRANLESRAEQVVDARDADRFCAITQDTVHNLAGGHIPGSLNLHFPNVLGADGTFLEKAALERAFADAGIDLAAPVIGTCGSGMTASVLLFAMELIGKHDTALYDGSWSEWGADPATPKETGPSR